MHVVRLRPPSSGSSTDKRPSRRFRDPSHPRVSIQVRIADRGCRLLPGLRICVIARIAMAAVKKPSPGYHIDGRVSIALDALDDDQKRSVDGVLKDRDRFVAN